MPHATTPSGRISYTINGPDEPDGDPQTLLLIMGLAGSGAMWFRLLPHVRKRYRTIVFDNRGTGNSSPVKAPLTMAEMAADALAVLDATETKTAHVMGASMGGMIAQHLALDRRDRVSSLILACTTAGGRREPPNLRLLVASGLRPLVGPNTTFGIIAPALYSRRSRTETPERVRQDMLIRGRDRIAPLTPLMQMAAIARHDTRRRLHELAGLPTLVVHGTEDRLISVNHGRELARLIPGSRLVELEQTGHLIATDAEEAVADAVLSHLERNSAAAAAA
jgi:aminoacrylate hydrolase